MKYMLLIYGNQELWTSFSPGDTRRAIDDTAGETAVTDGPYRETKEYLASYYLVDVEDEPRALALAAELPFAEQGAVEVWPVLHESGPR